MIIVHINIQRGLNAKAAHLEEFCDHNQVDILGVTECDSVIESIPNLHGFKLLTQQNLKVQRLIVYVRKGTKVQQIEVEAETPTIALRLGSGVLVFTYSEFTHKGARLTQSQRLCRLYETLELSSGLHKDLIIIGDLNIHFESPTDPVPKRCINWCASKQLRQVQFLPTRREAVLDVVLVRGFANIEAPKISDDIKSDHKAVIVKLKSMKTANCKKQILVCTLKNVSDLNRFKDYIVNTNGNVETEATKLLHYIKNIHSEFHRVEIRREKTGSQQWFNKELHCHKRKMQREESQLDRKKLKNKFTNMCRRAKRNNIQDQINAACNQKGIWSVVRPENSEIPPLVRTDGSLTSTDLEVCEVFLKKEQDKAKRKGTDGIIGEQIDSSQQTSETGWNFVKTTTAEVENTMKCKLNKSAQGPHGITQSFMKRMTAIIAKPIAQLFNMIIDKKRFPSCLNLGNSKPIYKKKGRKNDPNNYRLISLISPLAKVIECLLTEQIKPHSERTLTKNVFGYRDKMGTANAINYVMEETKKLLHSKQAIAWIGIDIAGAFENVAHSSIVKGLADTGANKGVLELMASYLAERTEQIKYNQAKSPIWAPNTGIGAGRPLSGYLFNVGLYTRTSTDVSIHPAVYSDDQLAILSADSNTELTEQIQGYYLRCKQMFTSKGLSVKTAKTEIVCVKGSVESVLLDNQTIFVKNSLKFLGYTLDAKMSPAKHIEDLRMRVQIAANKITRWRHSLEVGQLRTLYMAWINGTIMANAQVFMPLLQKTHLNRLQTAVNRGIRAILGLRVKHKVNMAKLRKRLQIPSIKTIKQRVTAFEAWKQRKKLTAEATTVEGPMTRARSSGVIRPKNKKDWLRFAFNQLSPTIRLIDNPNIAKRIIKKTFPTVQDNCTVHSTSSRQ